MTSEQAAAFVFSQSVAAMAEIEGMKVTNAERAAHGHSPAYNEGHFMDVANRYGVSHNSVCEIFREANSY
jgi:hypothetical protein